MTGCLGKISLSDVVTAGTATAGAAVSSAAGLPVAGTAIVTAASGAAGAALVGAPETKPEDFGGNDGQINTFWELASFAIANFFNHLIGIGILAGAVFLIFTYIGMRMPRKEEKTMEKLMIKKLMDN